MSKFKSLSVVLVAFNEQENLRDTALSTIRYLDERVADPQMVIVDDGSTDRTGAEAAAVAEMKPWISVCKHPRNKGIGAALKTGYGRAEREYVTFLPADGQIAPESIDVLIEASQGSDLVISAYRQRQDSAVRWVLSRGLRFAVWLIAGERVRSEGIYLVKRSVLEEVPLRSDTFFLNLELPIRAAWSRYAVTETWMEALPRRSGQSKVANIKKILEVVRDLGLMRLEKLGILRPPATIR